MIVNALVRWHVYLKSFSRLFTILWILLSHHNQPNKTRCPVSILSTFHSIAESEGKTLVSDTVFLVFGIFSLLNLTQALPCPLFLAIDVLEHFSMDQKAHDRDCTYRYENLVSRTIVRLVIISVNFFVTKSAVTRLNSISKLNLRAAAILPISWNVPNRAMVIPRFLGSKLLTLIQLAMIGWELGETMMSVMMANLTQE